MTRPLSLIVGGAICLLCAIVSASRTAAQFETPNRSFHNATGFRLEGKHLTVACEACHLNGQFRGTPAGCYDCHWLRRKDDRYQTRLGTQCADCHRPIAWSAVTWDHAAQTGIPLNSEHRQIACESCHRGASFRAGTTNCASCHQKDYAATKTPNHAAAGFPLTCEICHRPGDSLWQTTGGAGFNHNAVFALVGVHATQSCNACHKNNIYRGTSRDCFGCHRVQYERTQNPNHVAAGFPTTCEVCHRSSDPSFAGSGAGGFNHNQFFALVGVHAAQSCAACHRSGIYRGTARDCIGCHQADYNATRNPSHGAANFPTTCETCHRATDVSWTGASFNHTAIFALVGVHATQPCAACHKTSVYRGTSRDCVGCHQADYNATRNPNHAAASFPTACETCHRATDPGWTGTSFNHAAVFALVGVHATQPCAACHSNNIYRGTSRDCAGCHLVQYNATRNPNHAAANFPTTCDTCHRATDARWTGASFNHNVAFALVGVHATQPCAACHVNNVYRGTPRECVGCHLPQYNATRNPNHAAAGFPVACATCHRATDSSWSQGTFNHTRFPLSGRHNVPCAQCHTTPNNFAIFSCTVCHTRAATDGQHRGRAGYVYDSTACYACHPTGRGG